jgi:hypothetical protein
MMSPGMQDIADADTAVSSAEDANGRIHRTMAEPCPEQFAFRACVPGS